MGNFQFKFMVYLQRELAVFQAGSLICLKPFLVCQNKLWREINRLTEISLYISVVFADTHLAILYSTAQTEH